MAEGIPSKRIFLSLRGSFRHKRPSLFFLAQEMSIFYNSKISYPEFWLMNMLRPAEG